MGRPLTAPAAYAEGLVLTEDGVADPYKKKRMSAPQGWPMMRKGWKPKGRDCQRQARFTTAHPARVRHRRTLFRCLQSCEFIV